MAVDDEGFELLPPDSEPPDADAALELEDAFADAGDSVFVLAETAPPPLGRTPAYDFVQRTFKPSTSGGPLMLSGLSSLGQWIEKCLRTRRDESPAVDPDFGVTVMPEDLIDGGVLDEGALSEAYEDWTEALSRHPRVSSVDEWEADYEVGDDAVYISFAVGAEGEDGLEELVVDRLALPIGES